MPRRDARDRPMRGQHAIDGSSVTCRSPQESDAFRSREVLQNDPGRSDLSAEAGPLKNLRPLSRHNRVNSRLHDEIYFVLCQALMAGEFVPGQAISPRSLSEHFGTSLIPVRDAVKRLVAERVLTMLPNRTVSVPQMTRARFQELLQVRLSLESMLVRRAVEHFPQEEIAELEAIDVRMQQAAEAGEVKSYLSANRAFHFKLYGAADSVVALPIVDSLWMQAGPFLNGIFTAAGTKNARDNHEQILKSLRRRDPLAAAEALAADLMDAADVILARRDFVFHED